MPILSYIFYPYFLSLITISSISDFLEILRCFWLRSKIIALQKPWQFLNRTIHGAVVAMWQISTLSKVCISQRVQYGMMHTHWVKDRYIIVIVSLFPLNLLPQCLLSFLTFEPFQKKYNMYKCANMMIPAEARPKM